MPTYLPKRNKNICLGKNMCVAVHHRTIHSSPKLATTQTCISRRRDKQTVVHPHSGKPLGNKREGSTDVYHSTDESQMHYARVKPQRLNGVVSFTQNSRENRPLLAENNLRLPGAGKREGDAV